MEYKYDLAISLCDEDAELGWKICEELGNPENIFFYKKNIDDLVFRDGINLFGNVFAIEARFILVLYRSQYGQTDWTALEYNIIKERFKKTIITQNSPILFCKLDNTPSPNWLGEAYIYGRYDSESDLPNLTRRIRKSIIDFGGFSYPKSSDENLALHITNKRYEEEYNHRRYTDKDLAVEAESEIAIVTSKLYERFKDSAVKLNLTFDEDKSIRHLQYQEIRIILEDVLLLVRHSKKAKNSISDSTLKIILFTVQDKDIISGDMFDSCYREKEVIKEYDLQFYITINKTLGWRDDNKNFFSTTGLIELIYTLAVNHITGKKTSR